MKLSLRAAVDALHPFSRFFVERPRFAAVIAVVLSLSGAVSIVRLPITQYPQITPPCIRVSCSYSGANAREVMNTIAAPLEDEVNGVEDMIYMTSSCTDSGNYSLSITFEVGTDRDAALMKVQNRVQQALTKLPTEVKSTGLRVRCASEDELGFICLRSPSGKLSRLEISDFAYGTVQPALLRVEGVGDATVRAPKMAMRVWLDPQRLAAQKMNSEEVVAAIRAQNVQASIGSVGSSPALTADGLCYTLLAQGRLKTPDEFGNIVVRTDEKGGLVRLKDVARVGFGEQTYQYFGTFNNGPSVSIDLNQMPGSNAIKTVDEIRKTMAHLARRFPGDLEWSMPYDATDYVRCCIREIVETLLLTVLLVALVCWLFLQDWRATLVPVVAIPVSLLATFVVMAALGYSVNILTLFGLVLAIGTVVDDAIVVVERVQVLMTRDGLNAKEAAIQAMNDVSGAVVATTLVLLGIFVPVGFIGGVAGRIYQQFSVTLSAAVVFSSICALTLSPAMCALLLRPVPVRRRGPFAWFNRVLDGSRNGYVKLAGVFSRRIGLTAVTLLLAAAAVGSLARKVPTAFIPEEDQGVIKLDASSPEGSTLGVTIEQGRKITELIRPIPGVASVLNILGYGAVGGIGENQASSIVSLLPWSERTDEALSVRAIRDEIRGRVARIAGLDTRVFTPPAVPGMGSAGGVVVTVESRGDTDAVRLEKVARDCEQALLASPIVSSTVCGYTARTPHLRLDIDRVKCELYKVPLSTLYATLQNYLGSLYVNDVNLGTQVNRVTVQADWAGRSRPESVLDLQVRSTTGAMVPVGTLASFADELGPRAIYRRNQYIWCSITVYPIEGVSSGECIEEVKAVMDRTLPPDYDYDWTGLTFHEMRNRGTILPLLALAFFFGYLFLVAQYESWTMPLGVMLSVVTAALGALLGLKITGLPLSVYAQLGLVLLIGLASKNAILIVEFARDSREQGQDVVSASLAGAGERFRAVLMTALTFVLGILPMVVATGAGAGSRRAIGITTFSGMMAATLVGIVLVPGLYVLFQTMRERMARRAA